MTGPVLAENRDGVLRLTLNDPSTRNSLSLDMMAALQREIDAAAAESAVRVIVIAATGPVFSSGHNLKDVTAHSSDTDGGEAYYTTLFDACSRLMLAIAEHPKPVIAEVRGAAVAAGCQLVASCDMAYASQKAQFCTPGVNIGLFCSTPAVAISRSILPKHAMEMLLTADLISAAHAERIGLVTRAVPDNALGAEVEAVARRISQRSQMTLTLGKRVFREQAAMPHADALAHASRAMVENLLRQDAKEGISAFLEKRAPHWKDL
jgi:enoyl-CoA hydratase/carnithine racemase